MKSVKFIFIFLFLFSVGALCSDSNNFTLTKAVKLTLDNNSDILIQKINIDISKANIKISSGKFDTLINPSVSYSHYETPITPSKQQQINNLKSSIAVTKQLRTGISLGAGAETNRDDDIASSLESSVSTKIFFSINIPLLEGFGMEAADAEELAAQSQLKESEFNLAHTVAYSIYQTALLYWQYLKSVKDYKELENSLNRTEQILKQVKVLISKNFRPKSDIEQILASLSKKRAQIFSAKQNIINAKNNIIIFLGLDENQLNTVSFPATDFPVIYNGDYEKLTGFIGEIKKEALTSRFDYQSLIQNRNTIKIQLANAKNKLKSNLDINFNVSYKRLNRDDDAGALLESFYEKRPGLNTNIVLNYKFPVNNNFAKGLFLKYKHLYLQNITKEKQLKRTIFFNIDSAFSNIEKSYNAYNETAKYVEHSLKSIQDEKQKYKLGMSTILDVINLEEQLTSANLNKISAHYNLAIAIAKFKYETGKLIIANKNGKNFKFEINGLTSLKNFK